MWVTLSARNGDIPFVHLWDSPSCGMSYSCCVYPSRPLRALLTVESVVTWS